VLAFATIELRLVRKALDPARLTIPIHGSTLQAQSPRHRLHGSCELRIRRSSASARLPLVRRRIGVPERSLIGEIKPVRRTHDRF
jgi:hypothetical protein